MKHWSIPVLVWVALHAVGTAGCNPAPEGGDPGSPKSAPDDPPTIRTMYLQQRPEAPFVPSSSSSSPTPAH